MLTSPQPTALGRVISVRGSQARVGLVTTSHINESNVRATVGQFFGIRTATTTLVAIITEVSRENLPPTDNYIAIASVDLLGEIGSGPTGRFQRGVTSYPTIGDLTDVLTNEQLRTVYAPSKPEQIHVRLAAAGFVRRGLCRCRGNAEQAFRRSRLHRRR